MLPAQTPWLYLRGLTSKGREEEGEGKGREKEREGKRRGGEGNWGVWIRQCQQDHKGKTRLGFKTRSFKSKTSWLKTKTKTKQQCKFDQYSDLQLCLLAIRRTFVNQSLCTNLLAHCDPVINFS